MRKQLIKHIKTLSVISLFFVVGLITVNLQANDKTEISDLLKLETAPAGVVFEIAGWSGDYLKVAFKKVDNYKIQLRKKFPKLNIAVVSHGSEQFSLTKDKTEKFKGTHQKIKRLIADDIPVYVCGNHSKLRGVDTKQFPNYLKIAKRGPLQIKHYQDLGYQLIVIE